MVEEDGAVQRTQHTQHTQSSKVGKELCLRGVMSVLLSLRRVHVYLILCMKPKACKH